MKIYLRKLSLKQVALAVTSAYILLSYIGQQEIMSESIQQITMWLMLGINFLLIFLSSGYKKKNHHTIWYAGLLGYVFISGFYSPDLAYALESVYSMFVTLLIAFCISQIISTENDIIFLIKIFSISGAILFVLMAQKGLLIVEERLGTTLFSNANIFAMLVMISLMCSIYLIFVSAGIMKVLYFVCAGTQFYMLLLSAGRKYILVSVVFIFVVYLMKNGLKKVRSFVKAIIFLGIVCILGYYIMFKIPMFYEVIGYRFENTINSFIYGIRTVEESGDIVRTNMIQYGLHYFSESPFCGNGQGGFAINFQRDYGRMVYSHNNYIELLANLGVCGFVYYYLYYFRVLWRLIRQRIEYNKKVYDFFIVFLIVVLFLDFGIVSYYSQNLLQVFIAIAIKVAYQQIKYEKARYRGLCNEK